MAKKYSRSQLGWAIGGSIAGGLVVGLTWMAIGATVGYRRGRIAFWDAERQQWVTGGPTPATEGEPKVPPIEPPKPQPDAGLEAGPAEAPTVHRPPGSTTYTRTRDGQSYTVLLRPATAEGAPGEAPPAAWQWLVWEPGVTPSEHNVAGWGIEVGPNSESVARTEANFFVDTYAGKAQASLAD